MVVILGQIAPLSVKVGGKEALVISSKGIVYTVKLLNDVSKELLK